MLIHVDTEHQIARVLGAPLGLMTETDTVTLKAAREAMGMSQQEMAEMCGCSRNYYAQIERGERRGESVSLGLARSICGVLHRHIDNIEEFAP